MSWLARFMRVNSRVSPTRRRLCVMPYRIPPLGTPSLSAIQRKAMHVPMAPRVISNGIARAKLTSALHLTTFWIAEPMRGAPIPIVSLDISLIGSTELVRTCLQIRSGQPHPARGLAPSMVRCSNPYLLGDWGLFRIQCRRSAQGSSLKSPDLPATV
jgi:hypothetical protein